MIIDAVRNFITQCPHLDEFHRGINVNFLDQKRTSYTIEEVPANTIVKRYVNGDTIRQALFIFASRESYGSEILQQLENSRFYEQLSEWFEEQTHFKSLPKLEDYQQALKIEATTCGYAYDTEADRARYQIQFRLEYLQKGLRL